MSNIVFRPVESNDAKQFVELINFVWKETYKNIFPAQVFLDMESKKSQKIENFSNNFYNSQNQFVYVAEDGGKIVGVACGRTDAEYEYYRQKGYANLQILYVLPSYQKQGIATKLKNIFVQWLKEKNIAKYFIGVLKENEKAQKVYEKWGGKLDAYTKPFVKLGVGYDEVFYTFDI